MTSSSLTLLASVTSSGIVASGLVSQFVFFWNSSISSGNIDVDGRMFSCCSPHVLSNFTLNLTNQILNDPYPCALHGVGPSRLNSSPIEKRVEPPDFTATLALTAAIKWNGEN